MQCSQNWMPHSNRLNCWLQKAVIINQDLTWGVQKNTNSNYWIPSAAACWISGCQITTINQGQKAAIVIVHDVHAWPAPSFTNTELFLLPSHQSWSIDWHSSQFCTEIERQNLQTAPSDEQTGFVVQWDNEGHAVYADRTANIYMNQATVPGWIKTGGELKEREKWNVTTKLCGMNSFHSNTKRMKEKKQDMTSEMASFKVQNELECVLYIWCAGGYNL